MAEETAAERRSPREAGHAKDKERRDAEAAGNIDKVLKHLDGIGERLDALEKSGKRADCDPEREEWMRDDAAMCTRDDAEEAREIDRLQREEGMAQPVAENRCCALRPP